MADIILNESTFEIGGIYEIHYSLRWLEGSVILIVKVKDISLHNSIYAEILYAYSQRRTLKLTGNKILLFRSIIEYKKLN